MVNKTMAAVQAILNKVLGEEKLTASVWRPGGRNKSYEVGRRRSS